MPKTYSPYNNTLNGLMFGSRRRGLGSGGVTQTTTGKVATDTKVVAGSVATLTATAGAAATIAGTTLAEASPAFGAAAPIVLAVAAVVVAAAVVLDAIAGSSKDKATLAAAGKVNQLNATLRMQIEQVNTQITNVTNGLAQIQEVLQQNGFSGIHFGDLADNILANANASNADLQSALDMKVTSLKALIADFTTIVEQVQSIMGTKSNSQKVILYGLIVIAAGAIILTAFGESKPSST